jgi:hypothetical protein
MKNKSLTIAVVAAVALMLVATSAVATEDAFADKKKKKKYEQSQALSQANACGNGFMPTNVGCQNTASQIQGDENAVAQAAQQTFPEFEPVNNLVG